MLNTYDILETIRMIQDQCLDIRTITMGISLLDCIDPDIDRSCEKIYEKVTGLAQNLVKVGNDIETEYGIPIINKRISVTPIAILAAAAKGDPLNSHAPYSAVPKPAVSILSADIRPWFKKVTVPATKR